MTVNSTYPILDGNEAIRNFPSQLDTGVDWPAQISAGLAGDTPAPLLVDDSGRLQIMTVLPPSGRTPVEQSISAPGASGTLNPIAGRPFNITGSGTFTGLEARLERSFDGGATWHPLTGGGFPLYSWTAAFSETAVEYETAVLYRLNVTAIDTGALVVRISQ